METRRVGATAWLLGLLGLALALGLPELNLVGRFGGGPAAFSAPREWVWWGIGIGMLLYVRFVERRPLASIGLRPPTVRTFVIGVATALLLFASVIVIYAVVFPMFGFTMNREATAGITRNPIWFQVLLAARAGFVEEIVYRGYTISRIAELTGSKWIAIIVSIVVFTAVHVSYWGVGQLLIVAPAAIVLALLFVWRRDLLCNMLAHFLVDTAGFLAATMQSH